MTPRTEAHEQGGRLPGPEVEQRYGGGQGGKTRVGGWIGGTGGG